MLFLRDPEQEPRLGSSLIDMLPSELLFELFDAITLVDTSDVPAPEPAPPAPVAVQEVSSDDEQDAEAELDEDIEVDGDAYDQELDDLLDDVDNEDDDGYYYFGADVTDPEELLNYANLPPPDDSGSDTP